MKLECKLLAERQGFTNQPRAGIFSAMKRLTRKLNKVYRTARSANRLVPWSRKPFAAPFPWGKRLNRRREKEGSSGPTTESFLLLKFRGKRTWAKRAIDPTDYVVEHMPRILRSTPRSRHLFIRSTNLGKGLTDEILVGQPWSRSGAD